MCMLLIAGGHETTAKLIANGVRLFGRIPTSGRRSSTTRAHDPGRRGAAALHEPDAVHDPHDHARRRGARRDHPGGSKVALLLGSGNRDPREFERPDEFDIFRPNPRILAFGHGAHVCLGLRSRASRVAVAFQQSSSRVPHYEIDEAGITYMHSGNVQGPTHMPITAPGATCASTVDVTPRVRRALRTRACRSSRGRRAASRRGTSRARRASTRCGCGHRRWCSA